jgi:transposase InsO family protein
MGWQEVSIVQSRREFVRLASQEGANVAELCRRFEISRTTGYKWLDRARSEAEPSFEDRSRRPYSSPARTSDAMEAAVVALRRKHPTWGGRKIRHSLLRAKRRNVPAASTITGILARHGLIEPEASAARVPAMRFEHEAPNRLWQMDFKGHFALAETNQRCHPLTVVDDHSRFSLELGACANERGETVQNRLSRAFRRYGLPERMLTDNGAPWGSSGEVEHKLTPLNVWLIRLGIGISHSRPCHPQTHGKNERFNGTLKMELLRDHAWRDLGQAQASFDRWREVYNHERPHEGIGFAVPADRYRASARSFSETLPPIEYPVGTTVRSVHKKGFVKFRGRRWRVPKALIGHPVGIDPTAVDGVFEVRFMHHLVTEIDLAEQAE